MEDNLTGETEQRKRPIILYIIIGLLVIIVIVLSIILADKSKDEKQETFNPIKKEHFIPVKDSFYTDDIENGAYSYHGEGTHLDSEYFKILDVYNMKPTKTRAILSNFKTYQQTSEYSSPCSLIIMILTYYKMNAPGERECSLDFGLTPEDGCSKDNYDRTEVFNKTTIPLFAKKLKEKYNLEVQTTADFNEDNKPFHNESQFSAWVKENINADNIIIVLFNDWAGQYTAIIGIDDLGTELTNDDVLIMADSYDTTDHLQDGYSIWSLEKFYHLWQHTVIPFYKNDDSINQGQFILIKKPKTN